MDRSHKLAHTQAAARQKAHNRRTSATARTPNPTRSNITRSTHARQQQQVKQLSQRRANPVWLKLLLAVQKVSMVLFISVFGLSSIVYGYTMHTQTAWRSQQSQLRRWQSQERQQAVMNENLKQQMAQTAEQKESGLVEPKPHQMIFIHSASPRQPKPPQTPPSPQPTSASKFPLGY